MPSEPPRPPRASTRRPTTRRPVVGGSKPASDHPGSSHRRLRIADVRRIRRQVLLSLYAILAGEAIVAAFTTPLLHIQHIQVRGTEGLPATEVTRVFTAASLPNKTNFLLAPAGKVQTRVGALPWVLAATVHRHFPNRITVDMTLREPVAQVRTPSGIWEVDYAGLPIRNVRPEMASRLPLIVWERPTTVTPGVIFGNKTLESALALSRWAQKETAVPLAKIEVDQSDNICLNMKDGIPIKFGPDSELESKQTLVANLYRRDPDIARHIQQIDVSCPSDVACTPRIILPTPATTTLPQGDTVVNRP